MRLTALLVAVAFLDELGSGVPFVGAPEIQREFGVSYGEAAGGLVFAMTAAATLIEPVIFLLADRYPKRRFVVGGLAVLGAASLAAGLAPSYWLLFAALSLYGPASGTGVALAQAALADSRPRDLERALVRWTFAGALGDLATPSAVALGAYLAAGWRAAFVAAEWRSSCGRCCSRARVSSRSRQGVTRTTNPPASRRRWWSLCARRGSSCSPRR